MPIMKVVSIKDTHRPYTGDYTATIPLHTITYSRSYMADPVHKLALQTADYITL